LGIVGGRSCLSSTEKDSDVVIHVEFRSFFERQCYNINARLKRLGENGIKPGRLPSVGAAPLMIAGIIATEVVNLITGKTPPLQALKKAILRKKLPL